MAFFLFQGSILIHFPMNYTKKEYQSKMMESKRKKVNDWIVIEQICSNS